MPRIRRFAQMEKARVIPLMTLLLSGTSIGGNGLKEPGEPCEDGNRDPGDGCCEGLPE